jgi:putative hydrolase of the HAD superfamily
VTPNAVIFDLFGTLIDNLDFTVYDGILSQMADVLHVSGEDFRRAWRAAIDDRMSGKHGSTTQDDVAHACLAMGAIPRPDRLDEACAIRVDFTAQTLKPASETLVTLAELRTQGYPIGLITDCTSEVPALWPNTPLAALIDHAVFSCREGITKPDPRIYLLACRRLGVEPGQCLYVGDGSSRELTGASEVGMRAILLKGTHIDFSGIDRSDALSWRGEAISSLSDILTIAT